MLTVVFHKNIRVIHEAALFHRSLRVHQVFAGLLWFLYSTFGTGQLDLSLLFARYWVVPLQGHRQLP